MKEYDSKDRLITKDDWEKYLKLKEEHSDKRLSNMPETPTKKETKYAVIEWHTYPEEKPKEDDQYLVSVNMWNKSYTSTSRWISSKDGFKDVWDKFVYAWAEMPEPYKEQKNDQGRTN